MGPPTTTISLDINGILIAFFGMVTSVAVAYAAYQSAKGRTAAEHTKVVAEKTLEETRTVAVHTNSMKDELIAEIKSSSVAREAAALAQGKAEGPDLVAPTKPKITKRAKRKSVRV